MSQSKDDIEYPAPHLTEAFQKARRNLALASGIFLAWEYVSVQVGGESELPGVKTTVKFLNPEVLPIVILLLVLYFAFRLSIEWFHCAPGRRDLLVSRIDVLSAYGLAMSAVALFGVQSLSDIRIADALAPSTAAIFLLGLVGPLTVFGTINLPMKKMMLRMIVKLPNKKEAVQYYENYWKKVRSRYILVNIIFLVISAPITLYYLGFTQTSALLLGALMITLVETFMYLLRDELPKEIAEELSKKPPEYYY